MTDAQQEGLSTVDASPVKSFFVSMLTRDIKLEEAILDLLDNCVDGILRSGGGKGAKPYEGFKAKIEFNADFFPFRTTVAAYRGTYTHMLSEWAARQVD